MWIGQIGGEFASEVAKEIRNDGEKYKNRLDNLGQMDA